MTRRRQAGVLLTLALFGFGWWWVQGPKRVVQSFVGHLSHARYAQAAALLEAPSGLEADAAGGLRLHAHDEAASEIAAKQLPFSIYGNRVTEADRTLRDVLLGRRSFCMLASGTLLTLQTQGGRVAIESIGSIDEH